MSVTPGLDFTDPAGRATAAGGTSACRYSDFSDVSLPALPEVRGMVTPSECRYLYWLTSRCYTGAGAVVEVGTWLGLSTVHLAAGLRDAGHREALHCFDRFVWHGSHRRTAALPLGRGDDFQPYFEANVRPIYPGLAVTKSSIEDIVWSRGPIEILFLDAPKHLVDVSAAFAALAPALVPGRSLLVFQDYLHPPAYALPAVVACLGDALEPAHIVAGGNTVGFRVSRRLDFGSAQPREWNYTTWSADEVVERWRRATGPLSLEVRARLWVGASLLLLRRGDARRARELVAAVAADPALRPHLQRDTAALLYSDYPALFRAAGLTPPPRGARRAGGVRHAIRRARRAARRWMRRENLTETIG